MCTHFNVFVCQACDFGWEDHSPGLSEYLITEDIGEVVKTIARIRDKLATDSCRSFEPLNIVVTVNGRQVIKDGVVDVLYFGSHPDNNEIQLGETARTILSAVDIVMAEIKKERAERERAAFEQSIRDAEAKEKRLLVKLLAKHGVPDSAP
jgi:hypothetical protein